MKNFRRRGFFFSKGCFRWYNGVNFFIFFLEEVGVLALLQDLIRQIEDPALRERIGREAEALLKRKKFGLVFEEHLPECTPLYDVPVRVGAKVALKAGYVRDIYEVVRIDGDGVLCETQETHERRAFSPEELVTVAEFGEAIYPSLRLLDTVERAPESELWHTLIEADNYHALQLLEYLYPGKVDCIYIDPPYNTGAKDWKYNNDYVDANDQYRHSKWLSMMEKRLRLAKKLLNPQDSVLIVTIDDKEYLHLGCLLEELFPEAKLTMISSVINPSGKAKKGGVDFSRIDEYIYFLQIGNCPVLPETREIVKTPIAWESFRRHSLANGRGKHGTGACGPSQFYPIYIDDKTHEIVEFGEPIAENVDRFTVKNISGCTAVFPVRDNGIEMNWGAVRETAEYLYSKGYLRVGGYFPGKPQPYSIVYLTKGTIKSIESGNVVVTSCDDKGILDGYFPEGKPKVPTTNWNKPTHNATSYGTDIITKIFTDSRFNYPKSLYAVKDCLFLFLQEKKDALILDFFAGSGTTLHAVNLLNAEDGGRRRCILVTNNEVSDAEAKRLSAEGKKPGDEAWEKLGIARYVTWPRTRCSILGVDVNGAPLSGTYGAEEEVYVPDEEASLVSKTTGKPIKKTIYTKKKVSVNPKLSAMKMADGFLANAAFFKLSFLDKDALALGRQFRELLPVLWMKCGARGRCPCLAGEELPEMLFFPENGMAVLLDEGAFSDFAAGVLADSKIKTVFLVTDSEAAYKTMLGGMPGVAGYQLYRDYLDNFRINVRR